MNEVAQWALLVTISVLVLGLYRELASALRLVKSPDLTSVTGPPLNRPLPTRTSDLVRSRLGNRANSMTIVCVSEHCSGCSYLLSQLQDFRPLPDASHQLVVVALSPSEGFLRALADLPIPVVADDEDEVRRSCGVTVTPFFIAVDPHGIVVDKWLDHDFERIIRDRPQALR